MKKLITVFILLTVLLSSTFSTSEYSNIKIKGVVKTIPYKFSLSYNGENLSNNSTLNEEFDLSKVITTKKFIVKKSPGNIFNNLPLSIRIEVYPFLGRDVANLNAPTNLKPKINFIDDYPYDYISYNIDNSALRIDVIIPAGSKNTSENIAAFKLTINGNSDIPVGNYVSSMRIEYRTT